MSMMAREQGLNNMFSTMGMPMATQGTYGVDPREQVLQQSSPFRSGAFSNFVNNNIMPQQRAQFSALPMQTQMMYMQGMSQPRFNPFQARPMFNQFQSRPMFNPYQPRPMFGGFTSPFSSFGGFGVGSNFGGFQPYQQRPMFSNFGGGGMNPYMNFAMNTSSFRGQNTNMMNPSLTNQQNEQGQQGYDYTQFANPGQAPTV